jgi:hypothetical protein
MQMIDLNNIFPMSYEHAAVPLSPAPPFSPSSTPEI